jgi:hypothetical protein
MSIRRIFGTASLLLTFTSCGGAATDFTYDVAHGWEILDKGARFRMLLGKGGAICADVTRIGNDENHIIVEQLPDKGCVDEQNSENPGFYRHGYDEYYYWIVILNNDSLIGPMSFNEFNIQREKHNVSSELSLSFY